MHLTDLRRPRDADPVTGALVTDHGAVPSTLPPALAWQDDSGQAAVPGRATARRYPTAKC